MGVCATANANSKKTGIKIFINNLDAAMGIVALARELGSDPSDLAWG